MKKVLFVFAVFSILLLNSCSFENPVFKGGETFSVQKIEGRNLKFTAGGIIYNPNKYTIKVKPSTLDVYLNDEYMGKVHLDKKIKMKKKQDTPISAPFTATLNEGAMFKAMRLANGGPVTVRLKGKVKAGVFIFSKKLDVDETRSMNDLNLRMN